MNSIALSLIIPAYNEERRLPATLAEVTRHLRERGHPYEILVVVNGSTDRTAEVAKTAAERDPQLRLILTQLRGKGRAIKIGVSESRGERILFCDADLSTPIDEAMALADHLDQRFPIVIASREGSGSRRLGEPYTRHLMGRGFNALVRALAVPGIQDTQCGFKAFSRACALDLFGHQTIAGFGFDVELLYIARKRGYAIRERPVTWVYRASSRVDPVRDTVRMLGDVLRVRLNDWRGKYERGSGVEGQGSGAGADLTLAPAPPTPDPYNARMSERILVCTAWPYVNGSLHVGHLAGVYVPADTFARFQRLRGNDVLMVSGSDEHGTPIILRADQEGVLPKEIADRYHAEFMGYWRGLGISYDLYTRTGTETHSRVVQDEFRALLERGYIFEESVEQFYDETARRFLQDRYIEGTCPHCGYNPARGDQCENCGRLLDPEQLIDPRSRLTGERPVLRSTKHLFFDLRKLNERLIEWVRPMGHWRPNVYRFTLNFLEGGLHPRAVTRDLDWGVPVPVEGYEDKRIYVWIEAVTGYLSASVEWAERRGQVDGWEPWWKDPQARQYYFIGKDNIPFHTVIWPAILMARGDTILPYDVPANEFMNFGGAKASKSANIGTTVPDLLAAFDPDPVRYYLTANAPESADSDFSADELIRRNNDELVATWGNLVHRTLTFAQRYFDGRVPGDGGTDPVVARQIDEVFELVTGRLEAVHFKETIRDVMTLAQFGNRYFDEKAPWRQVKEDSAEAGRTVGTLLNLLNALKVLFAPFLPFSSARLHELLGYQHPLEADGWTWNTVPVGQALPKPSPLFVKIETS